jgi:hypothetical protein
MTFRWGSKTKKWQVEANLHSTILEGKSIGSDPKKKKKKRAHDLENQDAS